MLGSRIPLSFFTSRLSAATSRLSSFRPWPPGRRAASVGLTVAVALGAGITLASTSSAEAPRTRNSFVSTGIHGWYNDTSLGQTERSDQYAQARVTGLVDGQHQAAFHLRYSSWTSRVLVAVSGTGWRIEPAGDTPIAGSFTHATSGLFRAEIQGSTVRVRWNDALVTTQQIRGSYPGRHVVATIRQPSPGVRMAALEASSLRMTTAPVTGTPRATVPAPPAPTGSTLQPTTPSSEPSTAPTATFNRSNAPSTAPSNAPSTSPSTEPIGGAPVAAGGGSWLSGASSDEAANGSYGTWRGTALQIGGTWDDSFEAQTELWSICGGVWSGWNSPLDIAVGGIFRSHGETWAAAARGSYDARWTATLTKMKSCWAGRDPSWLKIRFAHEMNLPNEWRVTGGEEADFVAAFTRFSNLRYRILPGAQLVFCPNDGTDGGLNGLDVRKLWPGRDAQGRPVADIYAVDSYNMWPHVTTAAEFASKINATESNGAPLGIERHRRQAEAFGVPFAISEWSNNGDPGAGGGGGESEVFVREFYAWAKAHGGDVKAPRAGQLLYEVQFNLWSQYQFWPSTVQPRTAAAYRALPWGR